MRMDLPLFNSCKLWLLFLHMMQLSISFSLQTGSESDMQSLLAFKAQITHDPFCVLTSWNHSLHFCKWSGVTCGRHHQRVVRLDLSSSKLQGRLSPHLGNLSFLRTVYLDNNSFTDHIPQELGRLLRLREMGLSNNTFSGVIPVNISRCSNLLFLYLQHNLLTGNVPVELRIFSKLQVLNFEENNLVGEIPPSLGNLSSLTVLSGWGNNLQGGIPSTIGQLKRLSILNMASNNLTGTIPSSVYNLSSLTVYDFYDNNFHGSFPPNLFQTLPNLEEFVISNNEFGGKIPVTLSNASHLSYLVLNGNNFVGKVPTMEGLQNLRRLVVGDNNLGEGEADDLSFLYSLANNTNLEILSMSRNNFGGALPEIISNFSKHLWYLKLEDNQIDGRIPIEIGNLIGLEVLGFGGNQLAGIIPSSIGNLQKLAKLYIDDNHITGSIPSSLGNITSLLVLNLTRNKLQGRIPSSLGNCQHLLELYLAGNRFSDSIPKEVISISSLSISLDLSGNQLTGSLPIEVGKLVNLGYLDFSNNKLSGEIPTSLGNCLSLETLYMGGNFLQGSIPQSLSSFRAIQHLNFSHNNFIGKIPTFLAEYRLLMSLDLSFNNLEGEVPAKGVFENATKISIVGNEKLCGGIPQLNLPKCSFDESKESISSTKLLLIIAISCGCLGIILMTCFLFSYCKRKEKTFSFRSSLQESLRRVTFEDMCQATEGFSSSNLIGIGNFGSVYRGILNSDGMVVAIKVLNLLHKDALKSFMAECKAWINIRHRNLIKVITVCSSIDFQGNDFKALVYEFMVNGNLDEWLHPIRILEGTHEERILDLMERLNIAVDVASALDYMHHQCKTPIIHCDLKPSNILLDGDMIAHVGDFGLARFLREASDHLSSNQSSSIDLKGTIGYAAPEYGMGSAVSAYGDIYSFGILLLEMFTGKRPTDNMFKDGLNLHNFVKAALPKSVLEVVDPILQQEQEQSSVASSTKECCMRMVLKVGVACSVEVPRDRIDISTAEVELHRIRDILLGTNWMHGQRSIADALP